MPNAELPDNLVDGIEGVRQTTREMLRAGADQIKIMTSGGVLSPNDEPGATGMTREEIAAVVYEAHAADKTVMSHAQATQGINNAVLEGVESIEHGIYLDEEVVAEMKRRGTFLVATLVAPVWVLRLARSATPARCPPYARAQGARGDRRPPGELPLAVEQGVQIAMGTDMGVGPHGRNAEELELMVEERHDADAGDRRDDEDGRRVRAHRRLRARWRSGKRADILAIEGDPLADIAVLQDAARIALVMKDGVAHRDTLGRGAVAAGLTRGRTDGRRLSRRARRGCSRRRGGRRVVVGREPGRRPRCGRG